MLCFVVFLLLTAKYVKYIIYLLIIVNICAVLKLICIVFFYDKNSILISPNDKIIDSQIYKIIVLTQTKRSFHDRLDLLIFVFFWYLFIFLSGFSIRVLSISIFLYKVLKLKIWFRDVNIFEKLRKELFFKEFVRSDSVVFIKEIKIKM
jgi:hypothetical protein